jgi:enterochelin esterase-like enzyme
MNRAFVVVLLVAAGAVSTGLGGAAWARTEPAVASFAAIERGPAGGAVWRGVIPDRAYPSWRRPSLVYVPPDFSSSQRYPTLYLLHGFRGSPYSIANGLRLAEVADRGIAAGRLRPFLAVMPPAGLTPRFDGEWTGPWERYVVADVVPWVDRNLPVLPVRSARAIAGLSAGGYGAVDIALRHAGLFGTAESWSGYFDAPRDGSLRHASAEELAANDPTLLARREASLLRRLRTRFFISCGTHDPGNLGQSVGFARELALLRLPHRTFFAAGRHDGLFWQKQLPEALAYAFGRRVGD